jgi:lysine 2,3-aminomutase
MKSKKVSYNSSLVHEEADMEPPSQPKLEISTKTLPPKKVDFPVSLHSRIFYEQHFPGSGEADWNDWQWQIRNSFSSFQQLSVFLQLSENEVKPSYDNHKLPVRITPYYASLLDKYNPEHALRKTMVPVFDELIKSSAEKDDPLSEVDNSPIPNLVHRYPDRVLFLITGFCAAYCRYCTRSHMVSKKNKCHSNRSEWDIAIDYIRAHPEVRDVLLSGGDPLTLPDYRLEYLLSKLREIPHVEIIRIGTKVPVVLPQRITKGLTKVLKKYHPLLISIHATHPDEITEEVAFACNRLANAGIPLGSQTVLLKGINDDVDVFKRLTHALLKVRVRPYYLYQCDPIPGSAHFRTPVSKGLEIIKGLRGFTSGYAIPHFVIDAPGGGGKIPLLPNYVQGKTDNGYLLSNYRGKTFLYPEDDNRETRSDCSDGLNI